MADETHLDCAEIVYRAISRARDRDPETGHPISSAFVRRTAPKDEMGLSINHSCDPEHCRRSLSKCFGVVSLHVGHVRELTLDVVPDPSDYEKYDPQHGNIVGLPRTEMSDEDEALAERLATKLVKMARVVPPLADAPSG